MTTHSFILTSALSGKEQAFPKTEKVDLEYLDFFLNNPDIAKEEKMKLRSWKKLIEKGCYVPILYKLGKSVKPSDELLGRLTALKGIGLQCFSRDIRNALAHRIYWDVDMVSAHPTICSQICKKNGIISTYQDEYLAHIDEKRSELMEALNLHKDMAKIKITSLYFGYENASDGMPDFFVKLHKEILNARRFIVNLEEWEAPLKFLHGTKENRIGKAFAYILQTIERSCLLTMDESASRNGRSLDTYIHDGGLIRKLEGETEFPEKLLRQFEKDIYDRIGYNISLLSKPMTTTFELSDDLNSGYKEMKAEFEKEVFSIVTPPCYIRVHNGKVQMLDLTGLHHIFQDKFINDELFITRWKADPTKKKYETIGFFPMQDAPPDTFNIFTGFPFEAKEGDCSRFLELVDLLCNHEKELIEYVLDWIAHLFQRPFDKIGVTLVIYGKKGIGKDTVFNKIGELLGSMFWNTSTPENDVFSRFNACLRNNLLIKFEEANFETNKANEDALKGLITGDLLSTQEKNEKAVTMKNYSRLVLTTNKPISVVADKDERRFCMMNCSDEKKGDRAFWNETYSIFARPETNAALMHMFLNRDIRNFECRNYPITSYAEDVMSSFIPFHARFFQRWIELNDGTETHEWSARELYGKMNESREYQMSETKFGVDMRSYPITALTKKKGRTSNSYVLHVEKMTQHLKDAGHWIDM